MPRVSVIVPCYNAAPWIRATLDSVLAQGRDDLELIVVDDGSTDAGAAIVAGEYPAARLIRTPNGGPSRARTVGTAAAAGQFIQYLDADDLLAPGKLERQLVALADSGADVAYGDWQRLVGRPGGAYRLAAPIRREMADPPLDLFGDYWYPPAVYLFRRSLLDRVHWREEFPVIQDARFALDCALAGGRFVYCAGVLAHYRVHVAGSVSTRSRRAFVRDCLRNTADMEVWWAARGGLDAVRRAALLQGYAHVARASLYRDAPAYARARRALRRLDPRYIPAGPPYARLVGRILGFGGAETLLFGVEAAKKTPPGRLLKRLVKGR